MASGEDKKPEIMGAICAPPPSRLTNRMDVAQPRQPASLNGLLQFAVQATKAEDAPHHQPMDENRRRFLEQALGSLTIDVVEELRKHMGLLEKVDSLRPGDDATQYSEALDVISDHVCQIDTANDFHKIGGFDVLPACLRCADAKVRSRACNLLAELCQNNQYCQRVFLENGFFPIVLNVVETDPDVDVVVKALYAVSCNVRQNPYGLTQFIQYKGVQVYLEALKRNEERITTKICFLLTTLCAAHRDFRNRLVFVGYIPALFSLIAHEPKPSHEHVLQLLVKIMEDNPAVVSEYRQPKYAFKEVLTDYLAKVKDRSEYADQENWCNALYKALYVEK